MAFVFSSLLTLRDVYNKTVYSLSACLMFNIVRVAKCTDLEEWYEISNLKLVKTKNNHCYCLMIWNSCSAKYFSFYYFCATVQQTF